MLLTVDPGAVSGWALFNKDAKLLVSCGLDAINEAKVDVDRAVIERPHAGEARARKKDLLTLAIRAGEWGGLIMANFGVTPEYVEPSKWKGSTPKGISQKRILARLTARERTIKELACKGVAESKCHNIVDAIGIGLWALGR